MELAKEMELAEEILFAKISVIIQAKKLINLLLVYRFG